MKTLPNNCRIGKFTVTPKNWDTAAADPKRAWRITYYFYDDNLNQSRQVPIKGMNHLENLKEKQTWVKNILKRELQELENGYNPITKSYANDPESEISENTGLIDALNYALSKVELEHNTRIDVTNSLKYVFIAIKKCHYEQLPISQVLPKHIKRILDACGEIKTYTDKKGNVKQKAWGPYQFNRYRTYLSLLFRQLTKNFIVQYNPVKVVEREPQLKKIREVTTTDQREKLKELTKKELYTFYRFIEVFFHSGSRIMELLDIKKESVYLSEQKFKIIVKKGKKYEEVMRTIKTVALPFWEEIMNEAAPGQYLFGEGLKPQTRDKPIRGEQISRRWRRHVKVKLGITADLYSLKHSNLDQIAKILGGRGTKEGIREAQEAAGHSTPVITMRYLPGQEERNHNELKDVANEL